MRKNIERLLKLATVLHRLAKSLVKYSTYTEQLSKVRFRLEASSNEGKSAEVTCDSQNL